MKILQKYKNTLIVFLLFISIVVNMIVYSKLSEISLIYTNYFTAEENNFSKAPFLVELYDNVYGYVLFRRIGKQLVKGLVDDKDKIVAVSNWVFNNILQKELVHSADFGPYLDIPIIDDNFLNVVRRGYGYCDQSSYVLCTMMHWLGFKSKMLMLRNETGESPHTVAVVITNGREYIIDTTLHFIFFDDNGEPISIGGIKNHPELFKRYKEMVNRLALRKGEAPVDIKPEWFENGKFFETFPFCSKAYLLKKIKEKLGGSFVNLIVPSAFASETPFPFYHPVYIIRSYDKARINCLLGDLEKALKILNSVKINKDNKAYIHFLFEKGYILYKLKRYQEAKEYFEEVLALAKPHFLKNGAHYFLKKINESKSP